MSKVTTSKASLPIPANTLAVGIGAILIFGFGVISSLVSEAGMATNDSPQVQTTPSTNITQPQ